jgi:hypothetical protein
MIPEHTKLRKCAGLQGRRQGIFSTDILLVFEKIRFLRDSVNDCRCCLTVAVIQRGEMRRNENECGDEGDSEKTVGVLLAIEF